MRRIKLEEFKAAASGRPVRFISPYGDEMTGKFQWVTLENRIAVRGDHSPTIIVVLPEDVEWVEEEEA